MSELPSGRTKGLQTMSRQKLKAAVRLLTGHTSLIRAHMFKLGLTQRQDCRLCGNEKDGSVHIVCHCPTLACKRYRNLGRMLFTAKDLEDVRVNGRQYEAWYKTGTLF